MASLSSQFIVNTFASVSLAVIGFCLILHLVNHFGLVCVSPSSIKRCSHRRKQCICCCLYPSNGHIEFYPVSTLFYFCFLAALIALIIFHNLSHQQLPFLSSLSDIQQYCPIISNTLSAIEDPLQSASYGLFTTRHSHSLDYIDYLWPYTVLVLVVWESLFNFWRFYDASFMATHFRNAGKLRVSLLFSIYAIVFSVLYLAQIHVSFALFPMVALLHLIFNIYCIHGFVSILRTQYTHFTESGETMNCIQNRKIIQALLHIIHRVKICAAITTFISTVLVLITNGCSNSSTITLLLPPCCMISCIAWSLHFVKNEAWFRRMYKKSKCLRKQRPNENHKNHTNGGGINYRHDSVANASSDTLSLSPKSTCNLKASSSPSTRSADTVEDMIIQPSLQNIASTSPGMETSEEIVSPNAMQVDKIELESSIPVDIPVPPLSIGFTKSISSHLSHPHVRNHTRTSLDIENDVYQKPALPVLAYTHSGPDSNRIHLHMDKSIIPTTNSNHLDHSDDTEIDELESLQYPTTSKQTENSNMSNPANTSYDFDTDGFPETARVTTLSAANISAIPDLYGVHGDDDLARLAQIHETRPTPHPLTPASFLADGPGNKQHQRCFSNVTLSEAKRMSVSSKPGPLPHFNVFVVGADGAARKYSNSHRRSLSTMSGLAVKAKQTEAMAASSILNMMVNQGFYSKSGRNLAL